MCSLTNSALSLSVKHLVIGQRENASICSDFHWSPDGSPVSNGQHFINTRVTQIQKRPKQAKIPNRTEADLIIESYQAVRAVHRCNS